MSGYICLSFGIVIASDGWSAWLTSAYLIFTVGYFQGGSLATFQHQGVPGLTFNGHDVLPTLDFLFSK